jgi:hypothetical protein
MKAPLLFAALALTLFSCNRAEPWQVEMTQRLDSMVALSESHLEVVKSIEQQRVEEAYKEMGGYQVFFTDHTNDLIQLDVPKSMFTGPLYDMETCTKYYGRVVGSFTKDLDITYNTAQLKTLRKDASNGALDSAQAVAYFNDEAFVLRDANKRINKSYGACFTCLRTHDELVATLDSLKNYILATNVPTE